MVRAGSTTAVDSSVDTMDETKEDGKVGEVECGRAMARTLGTVPIRADASVRPAYASPTWLWPRHI